MAIVYNFISNSPYFRDVTVIFKVSDYYMKRTVELMYPFKEGNSVFYPVRHQLVYVR